MYPRNASFKQPTPHSGAGSVALKLNSLSSAKHYFNITSVLLPNADVLRRNALVPLTVTHHMARKRKSSDAVDSGRELGQEEMTGEMNPAGNMQLEEDFVKLCKDAQLEVPRQGYGNTQQERLHTLFRFLWWRNKSALDNEIHSFFRSLPSTPESNLQSVNLSHLIDRLDSLRPNTPHRIQKFVKVDEPAAGLDPISEQRDPSGGVDVQGGSASPTPAPRARTPDHRLPGVKSTFRVSKLGQGASISDGSSSITESKQDLVPGFWVDQRGADPSPPKQMSRAAQTETIVAYSSILKVPAVPTNANTSFASTSANTSFEQNGSFWSQPSSQQPLGTNQTRFSSFSDALPPPERPSEKSMAMSLLSTEVAERWIHLADDWTASQESTNTAVGPENLHADTSKSLDFYSTAPMHQLQGPFVQPRRAPGSFSQSSGRESDYGSSVGQSTIADLEIYADRLYGPRNHSVPVDCATMGLAVAQPCQPKSGPVSPSNGAFVDSPQLTNMRFTPAQEFAQLKLPKCFDTLPFLVQWEAQRLLQTGFITASELNTRWKPRSLTSLYKVAEGLKKHFQRGFELDGAANLDGVTMCGIFKYSNLNTGPIFDVVLHAPQKDKSSELQRRFGSDRVLYVDLPSMSKLPAQHKGRDVMAKFREMATKPQQFLGRRWILYVAQPSKKTKNSASTRSTRFIFFAIDDDHVRSLFDYVIPYEENKKQAARKLYTRLELYLSRTSVAFEFDWDDIDYCADDLFATRDSDDDRFLDPKLCSCKQKVDPETEFDPRTVMSDGCATMDEWLYWKIHRTLKLDRPRSALQARVAGSKGVWFRDPKTQMSYTSTSEKPPRKLIKLTNSQVKVNRDGLAGCEPSILSFNAVKCNSYAKASVLHPGFMSILVDRGVPSQNIHEVVRVQIKAEMDEVEQSINAGSVALRDWMHKNHQILEEKNRESGLQTLAGFPMRREERIVQMLEAGFDIKTCTYLAQEVQQMIRQIFDLKRKNYKIRLDQSTTLMGISDPLGILKPGQVHINFSSPFSIPSGMSWQTLRGKHGLVARNPALSCWDIQKVEFVSHPELEGLPDVAVFPSKGRRPLASFLQGGDYDGDTFWICWDDNLTRLFKNAPCPAAPPSEATLNITKCSEKLHDYVKNPLSEEQWCAWLAAMAEARLGPNLLGVVTKLHERLIYTTGDLRSNQANALVHLHDYLVDADKQGFVFDFAALADLKKRLHLPKLAEPAYWQFTKALEDDEKDTYAVDERRITNNVIDGAYFGVIQPAVEEGLKRIDAMLAEYADERDTDLTRFFEQTQAPELATPEILKELTVLKDSLKKVREFWGSNYTSMDFNDLVKEARFRYDMIQPHQLDHPTIKEWLRRCGHDLTIWDKIKASAFAKFQHHASKPGRFIFSVAGDELCQLKACHMPESRRITMEQYRLLKPRKYKVVDTLDEYASDHEDVEEEGDAVGETTYY